MYQLSDSESKDSDDGIRFKTDSTRNKTSNNSSSSSQKSSQHSSRYRESSPRRRRRRHSRSRSSERRRRHHSRERSHRERSERSESKKSESLSLSDEEIDRKRHPLKRKSSKHRKHRRSRSRSRSRGRESRQRNGRIFESGGGLRDDNKNQNFQEASDDRSDPPHENVEQIEKNEIVCLGPALPTHLLQKPEKPPEANLPSIGPALPPHLIKNTNEPAKTEDETVPECVETTHLTKKTLEPTTPTREETEIDSQSIGPALPPHLLKKPSEQPAIDSEPEPTSPSHLTNQTETTPIGPALPPHLQKTQPAIVEETAEKTCIGPSLPPHLRQKLEEEAEEMEQTDDVYGPLPPGMSANSAAHVALEERALQMKLDALNPTDDKAKAREEWMLELPDVKAAHLGLGPRQFRNRAGPDLSDRYLILSIANSKKSVACYWKTNCFRNISIFFNCFNLDFQL